VALAQMVLFVKRVPGQPLRMPLSVTRLSTFAPLALKRDSPVPLGNITLARVPSPGLPLAVIATLVTSVKVLAPCNSVEQAMYRLRQVNRSALPRLLEVSRQPMAQPRRPLLLITLHPWQVPLTVI